MFYQIIDNFLDEKDFNSVKEHLIGPHGFPWNFRNHLANIGDENDAVSFSCLVYNFGKISTPLFSKIALPIIKKARIQNLYRVLTNLVPLNYSNSESEIHTDHDIPHNVLIYYVNTNNGPTVLDPNGDNIRIDSVANRAVIFDGSPHKGVLQTDTSIRVNINITFGKDDNFIKT